MIKKLTLDFIALWNSKDVDSALEFLKDDVIVYSPFIQLIYSDNVACKIEGKENVRAYWNAIKAKNIGMLFTLESLTKIDHEIYTVSTIEGKVEKLYTRFTYTEYGKIIKMVFEYK